MKTRAATPDAYLQALAADRRGAIASVRAVILKNLPKGYEETVDFGMLAYVVPLKRYPDTYNGCPLMIAALASQKRYMSLYLMCVYGSPPLMTWFKSAFKKAGKKLDMGRSCVRFRRIEDLPLGVIGEAISRVPVDRYLQIYEQSRKRK